MGAIRVTRRFETPEIEQGIQRVNAIHERLRQRVRAAQQGKTLTEEELLDFVNREFQAATRPSITNPGGWTFPSCSTGPLVRSQDTRVRDGGMSRPSSTRSW